MRCRACVIWSAVVLLAAVDALLCHRLRLCFTDWGHLLLAGAITGAIALFYRLSGRSAPLARAAHWTLIWLVFVNAGTVLTYVAAAYGGAARDAELSAIDLALGFDWLRWSNFLASHPDLRFLFWLSYLSLFPQILVSIFWLSWRDLDGFSCELLLNNIVSLPIATVLFLFFPALGPLQGGGQPGLPVLLALRGGGPLSFDMTQLQGLISFPSYHTVLAVLLTYAHRRSGLLVPFAVVNGIMLVSIPTFGPHYLIDIVAGIAVAGLAIVATTIMAPAIVAPAVAKPAASIAPARLV